MASFRKLFLFLLAAIFNFGMTFAVYAETSEPAWVLDEQQFLQQRITASLTRILKEAAKVHQTYVQVLLTDQAPEEIGEEIKRNRQAWKAYYPQMQGPKTALLVVNTRTGENKVILDEQRKQDAALQESLQRIDFKLIQPMAKKGHIEKGLIEGTIAVVTVVGDVPKVTTPVSSSLYQWLKAHRLLPWLKFFGTLGFIYLVWRGFNRFIPEPNKDSSSSPRLPFPLEG